MIGAAFPVFAARNRGIGVPAWAFFIAKYFGSGVIIATAFIHVSDLLSLIRLYLASIKLTCLSYSPRPTTPLLTPASPVPSQSTIG